MFEGFMNHFGEVDDLMRLGEVEIRTYLQKLVQEKRSDSYINLAISSIKFYYEVVHGMPNRFYEIERPERKEKLPQVLSKEEVNRMILQTPNIKHKCIIELLIFRRIKKRRTSQLKARRYR